MIASHNEYASDLLRLIWRGRYIIAHAIVIDLVVIHHDALPVHMHGGQVGVLAWTIPFFANFIMHSGLRIGPITLLPQFVPNTCVEAEQVEWGEYVWPCQRDAMADSIDGMLNGRKPTFSEIRELVGFVLCLAANACFLAWASGVADPGPAWRRFRGRPALDEQIPRSLEARNA